MKSKILFVRIFVLASFSNWSWNLRTSAEIIDWSDVWKSEKLSSRNVELSCINDDDCTTTNSTCVEKKCQCPPNYVFNGPMTSCLKAATAYGDACEDTAQCTEYLSVGGYCANGICSCVKGYHYLHGRCIVSSGLGEKCRNNDECYVNSDYEALSCTEKICRCSDGFYQREYRTCRREANKIGAECMIDLDCTFAENARCDKNKGCYIESNSTKNKARRKITHETKISPDVEIIRSDVVVGSNCTIATNCEILGASECDASGRCACKRGHFANAGSTSCVPELGEKCQSNDTASIRNSVCREGWWSCKGATVPLRNNRECRKVVTVYNSTFCQFDEQCYVFGPDAHCDRKCKCNENSHYSKKKMFCWINRKLSEACVIDEDCWVKDFVSKLSCENSTCSCSTGTHLNAAGNACIGDTAVLGDPCTANDDCSTLKNSVCLNDTCTCGANHFNHTGKCVSGIGAKCVLDTDCRTQNSTCVLGSCSCMNGSTFPSADLCVPVSYFGGKCHYDVQCSVVATGARCDFPEATNEGKISGSSSTVGKCTCDMGHHYKYGRCYRTKVLGEGCVSSGECYVDSGPDSAVCLKGLCACKWNGVRLNETFCDNDASSTTGLSCLIIFTMLAIRFIGSG